MDRLSRFFRVSFPSLLVLAVAVATPSPVEAQKYDVHFRSAQYTARLGDVVTVGVGIANQPDPVTGFSFGVRHDSAKLTLQTVELSTQLEAILGGGGTPDDRFFQVNLAAEGGPGFTVGLILTTDTSTASIPAALDTPIFELKYLAGDVAGDTTLAIAGDLGSPKVPVLLDRKGISQAPVGTPAPVTSATVSVSAGPVSFLRGDTNQSGRLEITDAIIIVDYLFSGASLAAGENTRSACPIAMNVDGSVREGENTIEDAPDIDITDAVALLRYIFPISPSSPSPAAPFPQCGQPALGVTAAAAFSCTAFTCKS